MVQVGSKLVALLLILVMALGSVVLWLGVPIAWIYGASQLVSSSQPSMGPYVMVLVGIPVSMVLVGKALSKLNRVYGVVTHTTPEVRVVAPWRRSIIRSARCSRRGRRVRRRGSCNSPRSCR